MVLFDIEIIKYLKQIFFRDKNLVSVFKFCSCIGRGILWQEILFLDIFVCFFGIIFFKQRLYYGFIYVYVERLLIL